MEQSTSERTASLELHLSRDDLNRLSREAAHHGTCASDLGAAIVRRALERGLPDDLVDADDGRAFNAGRATA